VGLIALASIAAVVPVGLSSFVHEVPVMGGIVVVWLALMVGVLIYGCSRRV
jgi:hypothetical protein